MIRQADTFSGRQRCCLVRVVADYHLDLSHPVTINTSGNEPSRRPRGHATQLESSKGQSRHLHLSRSEQGSDSERGFRAGMDIRMERRSKVEKLISSCSRQNRFQSAGSSCITRPGSRAEPANRIYTRHGG